MKKRKITIYLIYCFIIFSVPLLIIYLVEKNLIAVYISLPIVLIGISIFMIYNLEQNKIPEKSLNDKKLILEFSFSNSDIYIFFPPVEYNYKIFEEGIFFKLNKESKGLFYNWDYFKSYFLTLKEPYLMPYSENEISMTRKHKSKNYRYPCPTVYLIEKGAERSFKHVKGIIIPLFDNYKEELISLIQKKLPVEDNSNQYYK